MTYLWAVLGWVFLPEKGNLYMPVCKLSGQCLTLITLPIIFTLNNNNSKDNSTFMRCRSVVSSMPRLRHMKHASASAQLHTPKASYQTSYVTRLTV